MKTCHILSKFVDRAGGQKAFGDAIGASQAMISKILRGAPPGAELSVSIERFLDHEVVRPQLRPNDWWRIWPELIEKYRQHLPAGIPENNDET